MQGYAEFNSLHGESKIFEIDRREVSKLIIFQKMVKILNLKILYSFQICTSSSNNSNSPRQRNQSRDCQQRVYCLFTRPARRRYVNSCRLLYFKKPVLTGLTRL